MTVAPEVVPAILDRIRRTLVGLRMPRALEVLDRTVRQLERGEVSALDAIDTLLAEELTVRESRRIKTALVMARLTAVKTLAGFDFSFQPSLDRDRILALASVVGRSFTCSTRMMAPAWMRPSFSDPASRSRSSQFRLMISMLMRWRARPLSTP